MAKFITAKRSSTADSGSCNSWCCRYGTLRAGRRRLHAIRDNFAETGHPCDLNLKQASALGDWGHKNKFNGWDRNPPWRQII